MKAEHEMEKKRMSPDNQNKKIIPIAYATDRNYLFYTCVSITSLAVNANRETNYQIYILVGEEFVDDADLLGKLEKRYPNIQIRKIIVDTSIFTNVFINNGHISKAAFYRLALCDILTMDKCIYLDSDTIITEDLSPLYHCNMADCYLAGCRDIWIDVLSEEEREKRRIQTRIPGMEEYVNSGVLLFHLKKMREDKVNTAFLESLNYNYPYEDQDILNVCCYQHIFRLSTKWNRFTAAMGRDEELRDAGVSENIIQEFKDEKGIIHFITEEARPWEGFASWENWRWWQYAGLWNREEAYKKIYDYVEAKEQWNSWENCLKKYSKYCRIVIWGVTKGAMEMCRWLVNAGLGAKLSFCDSDERKQGQKVEGIEVKAPKQIISSKDNCFYIIASPRWGEEIEGILLDAGVRAEEIQIYRRKSVGFYRMLDSRYYNRELEEVFLKEGISVAAGQEIQELLCHEDWIEKYSLKRWILKEKPVGNVMEKL